MNESSLTAEVERRLDNLFEEVAEEESLEQAKDLEIEVEEESGANEQDNIDTNVPDHLDSLKSIVLSLEWEISDELMEKFLAETDGLKKTYEGDKIVLPFVQILHSLGKYIKTYKAKAHPSAIKLLNNTFQGLSQVVTSPHMEDAQKKKILLAQVKEFRKLKEEVTRVAVGTRGIQKQVRLEPGEIENVAEAVIAKMKDMWQESFEEFFQQIKRELESIKGELKRLEG